MEVLNRMLDHIIIALIKHEMDSLSNIINHSFNLQILLNAHCEACIKPRILR